MKNIFTLLAFMLCVVTHGQTVITAGNTDRQKIDSLLVRNDSLIIKLENDIVRKVDIAVLGSNTDEQTLSLLSNLLSIENGNSVSLAPYLDNTDSQEAGAVPVNTIGFDNNLGPTDNTVQNALNTLDDLIASGGPIGEINGLPYRELQAIGDINPFNGFDDSYDRLSIERQFSDTLYIAVPPVVSGYTVSFNQPSITLANRENISFTITNPEPGSGYSYTISSDGGGVTIIGQGIVANSPQIISALDLTAVEDGNVTLSIFLRNAGGIGQNTTDVIEKNTVGTVPSGYSVAINEPSVNLSNQGSISFTWASAEVGSTYNYQYTSSGGGTPVSGSGTIASQIDEIGPVDLSGLNDGTITLTASLTNGTGTGINVTDTVEKITSSSDLFPTGNIASAGAGEAESLDGWTFSGGSTRTILANTDPLGGGSWMIDVSYTGSDGWITATRPMTGLSVGQNYTATIRVKRFTDNGGGVYNWTNAGSPTYTMDYANFDWQTVTANFTAQATTVNAIFYIGFLNNGFTSGQMQISEIVLTAN